MAKKIGLISVDPVINMLLCSQLREIFGSAYEVEGVLLEELADINLAEYVLAVSTSRKYMDAIRESGGHRLPVIFCQRTIRQDKIAEILSLQRGTQVHVISNFLDTARETIRMLEEMGIEHLQMIPCAPEMEVKDCDVVITPSEDIVPEGTKIAINIGEKYIKYTTILEIFFALDTPRSCEANMIAAYRREEGMLSQYNKHMHTLLWGTTQTANFCVVCFDEKERIFFCNREAGQVLNIRSERLIGMTVEEVFGKETAQQIFSCRENEKKIIEYRGKSILIGRGRMQHRGNSAAFAVTMQDITKMRRMEQELQQKSKTKGFFAEATFENIIGQSDAILQTIKKAKKIAQTDGNVLIQGASGTGKEIFAQAIHNHSERRMGPFVAVNLSALSDELALSELMGYEEGSFTGARKGGKKGLFELANMGTIFLDEIGDISSVLQQRLLRVLQEKEVMPVGGNRIVKIDVRVIAATNRDLKKAVEQGIFREDLFYRLDVLSLQMPPLSARKKDIESLFNFFLLQHGCQKKLMPEALAALRDYQWSGNVRELANAAEYVSCLCEKERIYLEDLPEKLQETQTGMRTEQGNDNSILLYYLASSGEEEIYLSILQILCWAAQAGRIMGRKQIQGQLANRNIQLTEQQVRKYLQQMQRDGLLTVGRTKQGYKVAEKGLGILGDLLGKSLPEK